jgi:hypothetical protein
MRAESSGWRKKSEDDGSMSAKGEVLLKESVKVKMARVVNVPCFAGEVGVSG